MISINKYQIQTIEHFDPSNKSLGFLNEHENVDLRCQIAENKIEGYYMVFNNTKVPIHSNGRVSDWITGLYDTNELLLARLFKAQRELKDNEIPA